MRNKWLRRNTSVSVKRPVRVRRRLVAGVLTVGLAVLAAGAPAVYSASSELTDAQQVVTLAGLDQQAVSLAHALADERDDVTVYVAGGRHKKDKQAAARVLRVDDEIGEITAAAPTALRQDLATIPAVRRTALTGKGSALDANKAYSDIIGRLLEISDQLADRTPPEAAVATRAQLSLGRAVEKASATRGLLLAALTVPSPSSTRVYDPVTGRYVNRPAEPNSPEIRTRDELSGAAQLSRVMELAAVAEFDQEAGPDARESLEATVSGPEVDTAETYLTRLTDQPQLSPSDLRTSESKTDSALTARIDQTRGVESALVARQVKRLAALRDDVVTALEWRIGLVGALLLITVGVGAGVARTLTRPLAVLRIGAARLAAAPGAGEPIRFTGRNDEFAQVVRSINAINAQHASALAGDVRAADAQAADARAGQLVPDTSVPIGGRPLPAAERATLEARTADGQGHTAGAVDDADAVDEPTFTMRRPELTGGRTPGPRFVRAVQARQAGPPAETGAGRIPEQSTDRSTEPVTDRSAERVTGSTDDAEDGVEEARS